MNAIRRSIEVRCSIEEAFETFTDQIDCWWPPTHRRFSTSRMVLEGRVGGRLFERADDGREHPFGEVVECSPPHRLRYTWYPGGETGPTEVSVTFTAAEGATRVDVVHAEGGAGLGAQWPKRAELFERGWSIVLPPFKEAAESRRRSAGGGQPGRGSMEG